MPQRVGVVLVFVAAGDLVDPLADQQGQRMGAGFAPPFRDVGGDLGTDADLGIGSSEPGQPPSEVRCPPSKAASRARGARVWKEKGRCGRIRHEEASSVGRCVRQPDHTEGGLLLYKSML